MGYFFLIIIAIVLIGIIWKNHLIIRFDTLFRKGFKKTDDKYGVYTFVGKQRKSVRQLVALITSWKFVRIQTKKLLLT